MLSSVVVQDSDASQTVPGVDNAIVTETGEPLVGAKLPPDSNRIQDDYLVVI